MAQAIVGGEAYEVSLPNFKKLKAAWKFISVVQDADAMDGVDAILGIISIGSVAKPVTIDELEEKLTPAEMADLRRFVNDLIREVFPKGEAEPAKDEASPSTAISSE